MLRCRGTPIRKTLEFAKKSCQDGRLQSAGHDTLSPDLSKTLDNSDVTGDSIVSDLKTVGCPFDLRLTIV